MNFLCRRIKFQRGPYKPTLNFVSKIMYLILFLSILKAISAIPLLNANSEIELLNMSENSERSVDLSLTINNQVSSANSDNLDSNSDDVRVHKSHHHHHQHHRTVDSNENYNSNLPISVSSSIEYGEMCLQGRIFNQSEVTWKNSNCEICHCEARGVSCHVDPCPDLPCASPVRVENECCPVCPEKICEAADGRKFNDGSKWHLDDCTFCECDKGRVLCSVEDCEFQSCTNPVKVPGRCCPVCPDSSCHGVNGRNHTTGTVWKEGECTHCFCRRGEKVCGEEKCPHINCTIPMRSDGKCCYRCPDAIDCLVSNWGTWGSCPIQECGGGMRRRYRNVLVSPRKGGSFCPHLSEAKMCQRLPCNEIPVCPVTSWSNWSHCTATCGAGRRLRTRMKSKVTKATMTSLIDCSTTHMQETMRCYAGTCFLHISHEESPPDNDHCLSATWSGWSPCSVACGKGEQNREQRLVNTTHDQGHLCQLLTEVRQCHGENCTGTSSNPINCKVTHWSPWTPCSASCGSGAEKSKHRTILQHPSPEGKQCPRLHMTRPCRLEPCEVSPSPVPNPDNLCMSEDGAYHYAENEHWIPVECLTCSCVNSKKVCRPMPCEEPDCSSPVKLPGYCCPLCLMKMP